MKQQPLPAPWPITLGASLLAPLALGYLLLGLYLLRTEGQIDFELRRSEAGYVARGTYPFDVIGGRARPDDDLGELVTGGYPPWSYTFAEAFAPPSLPYRLAVAWYASLNLAAWGFLAGRGYLLGRRLGASRQAGLLTASAGVAYFAVAIVLLYGNYGLLVAGLLAAMVHLLEQRRPYAAGLCLGLAMVKPQLAALFFILPLARRAWAAVVTAALLVLAAWGVAAGRCQTHPVRMVTDMFAQGTGMGAYNGFFSFLEPLGVSARTVTVLGLVAGLGLTTALVWRSRSRDLRELACVPAVVSVAWVYHHTHDHVLLSFLGTALVAQAIDRGDRRRWVAVVLFGPWLWLPYLARFNETTPLVPVMFRVVWFAALWQVLRGEPRSSVGDPSPDQKLPPPGGGASSPARRHRVGPSAPAVRTPR